MLTLCRFIIPNCWDCFSVCDENFSPFSWHRLAKYLRLGQTLKRSHANRLASNFDTYKNDFTAVFRTFRVEEIAKKEMTVATAYFAIFVETKKELHILWRCLFHWTNYKSSTRKPMHFAWIFALCNIAGVCNPTECISSHFQHRELGTVCCVQCINPGNQLTKFKVVHCRGLSD